MRRTSHLALSWWAGPRIKTESQVEAPELTRFPQPARARTPRMRPALARRPRDRTEAGARVSGRTLGHRPQARHDDGRTSRNQIWEMDHKELPVLVLPARCPAVKPWLTTVIDDGTRALVGRAVAVSPHSGTVLAALRRRWRATRSGGRSGLSRRGAHRPGPGLPRRSGPRRARRPVRAPAPPPGYHAHLKGKVERVHRTIDQTLLCAQHPPGFTEGPRDAAGHLYGPAVVRQRDRPGRCRAGVESRSSIEVDRRSSAQDVVGV